MIVPLAGVMGLPIEGLRGPVGLLPDFFGPPGDERDLGRDVCEPAPALLPVLVPTLALFPLPELALEECFLLWDAFDSSNLTSLPTTRLFVVTKFTIHSGISPLLFLRFFSFSISVESLPTESLPGLDGAGALLSSSVSVEGCVAMSELKN